MKKLLALCVLICACVDPTGPENPEDTTRTMVQDSTGSITITIICPDCDSIP